MPVTRRNAPASRQNTAGTNSGGFTTTADPTAPPFDHDQQDKVADRVIPEPQGGAHLDPRNAGAALQGAIISELNKLTKISPGKLMKQRYAKFRRMGEASEYSQEAMTREVELLMSITIGDRPPTRRRQPANPPEPHEAYMATDD